MMRSQHPPHTNNIHNNFADRASQYIYLNINQLDALNLLMRLFHACTCFEYHVLIVRRSKFYYTVSGIITPIGGCHLRRLREDSQSSLNLCTGRPPIGVMIPETV